MEPLVEQATSWLVTRSSEEKTSGSKYVEMSRKRSTNFRNYLTNNKYVPV